MLLSALELAVMGVIGFYLIFRENRPDMIPSTASALTKASDWRLTPKESERLQGYPDGWTVLRKIESMTDEEYEFYKAVYITDKEIKGKSVRKVPTKKQLINWHNKLDVGGTRYRQLGNSLAIPCALRVIGYIADYIRKGESTNYE